MLHAGHCGPRHGEGRALDRPPAPDSIHICSEKTVLNLLVRASVVDSHTDN